jgi:hypothetical protein
MRAALVPGTVGLSVVWFLIGLSFPLTPSEGPIPVHFIVIFGALPVVAIAAAAQLSKDRFARWLLRGLGGVIGAVTVFLVAVTYRKP